MRLSCLIIGLLLMQVRETKMLVRSFSIISLQNNESVSSSRKEKVKFFSLFTNVVMLRKSVSAASLKQTMWKYCKLYEIF